MPGFHQARIWIAGAAMVAAATLSSATAQAQNYPNKPIRFIISFPPGGSADVVARGMQPHLERALGQPVVIDNRPGAGGVIGVDAVAKAPPDGYMIGLGAAGALAINVSLKQQMPYDPLTGLAPVTMLAHIPFLLVAPANSTTANVGEVVAQAKAKADAFSIGHGGNGTAMHLSAQLLNHMTGLNIPLVPYRGSGPVAQDVLAGHVPLGVVDIPSSISLIQAGQVKALAVSTTKRVPSLPQVPTFAESGLPGYESVGWFGLVAPAGTPPDVIAKINAAVVAALNDPTLQGQIRQVGAEPAPGTPAEFAGYIRSEIAKWAKVVEGTGAR
jgi:tripartite-type tricarboxylate transporter receptor subunit TctC